MPLPDFSAPDSNDLTTLAIINSYLRCGNSGSALTAATQMIITGASLEFLHLTGHSLGPTGSPFLSPQTYTETYNWDGSNGVLYTKSWPIVSISSCSLNGLTVQASTNFSQAGYAISPDQKSIEFHPQSYPSVMGSSPFYGILSQSRSYFGGSGGIVLVTTTRGFVACPPDVVKAVTQIAAANLNQAGSEYLAGRSFSVQGRSGSVSFQGRWAIPPAAQATINYYKAIY